MIAAGALAALAAQAWWQDRQDRERERDYLRHLLADVRENESRLAHAIATDSAVQRSAAALSNTLAGRGHLPPADTLVVWLIGGHGSSNDNGALSASDFQPIMGTFAALLATGDLRLIRNETLRSDLVTYAARMEDERANLLFYLQESSSELGRVGYLVPFITRAFTHDWRGLHDDARRFDFERLRGNPDAAALLFTLQVANANRLGHLRSMREQTHHLRMLLEAQPLASGTPAGDDSASRQPK